MALDCFDPTERRQNRFPEAKTHSPSALIENPAVCLVRLNDKKTLHEK